MVIQIWEIATCFLCDLAQHHCCPWVGGGHLHLQNLLPGISLNEQSAAMLKWASWQQLSLLLSSHTCAVAQFQPGNFFHLSFRRQL